MSGFLLYTASGDAEGTLGELVRQVNPEISITQLERHFTMPRSVHLIHFAWNLKVKELMDLTSRPATRAACCQRLAARKATCCSTVCWCWALQII